MQYDYIKCGDCLDLIKEIPNKSIKCVVTSPPYWKGFEYEAYFNSYKQYLDWSKIWMAEVKRVLTDDGTFYLNVNNDSETTIKSYELLDVAKDLMYKLHDTIIWYRYNTQPANTDRQLTNRYEYIFMLRKTSANTTFDKKSAYELNPDIFKTKNVGNVWEIPFNSKNKSLKGLDVKDFGRKDTKSKWGHSGFPIELPETCIALSTNVGDIVLDPFVGSGTTAVACKIMNRHYIGFDLSEKYCKIAEERINSIIF